MALIVTPKNKKEETVLKAFLNSLKIGFHSEADEDAGLYIRCIYFLIYLQYLLKKLQELVIQFKIRTILPDDIFTD